jgi:homospermidine synthase
MTEEIIDGRDILGFTFYFANEEVYWVGSTLCIEEARNYFDEENRQWVNTTNLQVLSGYLSGIHYILECDAKRNKYGLMRQDEFPHENIM